MVDRQRCHLPTGYLKQHRLWWSQYGEVPAQPSIWNNYWLWQHTDGHHGPEPHEVPGLGILDCDTFDRDANDLRAEWSPGSVIA